MAGSGVNAKGMDTLRRDLRAVAGDVAKAVDQGSGDVAREVVPDARDRAEGLGGVAGHVAPSIDADGAMVGLGGTSYPMAAGAEFGGQGRPTTQQFEPYRADGYFLYPAIRAGEDRADQIYLDRVDDLMRKHNL